MNYYKCETNELMDKFLDEGVIYPENHLKLALTRIHPKAISFEEAIQKHFREIQVTKAIFPEQKPGEFSIPDGFEIDLEKSTSDKLILKSKKSNWEKLEKISGFWVNEFSIIYPEINHPTKQKHRNIFPSKEEAEASLALTQLLQLRNHVNGNWKPNWEDGEIKFMIIINLGRFLISTGIDFQRMLTFKNRKIAHTFLEENKELLEIAKPLL